jgi:hypothetical protein
MSPADRNKYLIAAGVVVVAIIIVVFVFRGRRKAPTGTAAGGFGAGTGLAGPAAPGAPGQALPAPGGLAAAQPVAVAALPAGGPPMLGVIRIGRGSEVRTRIDPLLTFEPPPAPTPIELLVPVPAVTLQEGGLRPSGIQEVTVGEGPEIARRRVSGLLFDEGAYAILDAGRGQASVVKPGDIVQGNRIIAISRDSVFVEDPEGKRWQVRLRGLGVGGAATSAARVGGMPESPPSQE